MLTGVVEVGLFCGMAQAAYFGNNVGFFSTLNVPCLIATAGWERYHQMARRAGRTCRTIREPCASVILSRLKKKKSDPARD